MGRVEEEGVKSNAKGHIGPFYSDASVQKLDVLMVQTTDLLSNSVVCIMYMTNKYIENKN
jgi:hypothetical protein